MKVIIECLLNLKASHEIQKIGFKGGNEVLLDTPISINEPFGVENTTMEVTHNENNSYKLQVTSSALLDSEKQIPFVEKIAHYLSYLINKRELNPHYGTNFIDIEWQNLFAKKLGEDNISEHSEGISVFETLNIRDTVSISSSRTYSTLLSEWQEIKYSEIIKFYYDGLRAEHKKSKYFHWFLILEYLEGTDLYKRLFDSNKLFTDDEQEKIRELSEYVSDNVKKSAILNLLTRTKEFRNRKLLSLLNEIGITSYKSMGKDTELSENIIRDITVGRNKLFHKGTSFPDVTLWLHLFPIVTEIVGLISRNPNCID